jgi:hypothetical protein
MFGKIARDHLAGDRIVFQHDQSLAARRRANHPSRSSFKTDQLKLPPALDPGQNLPPDGGNRASGGLKIIWFISHNATEIGDFRFSNGEPAGD